MSHVLTTETASVWTLHDGTALEHPLTEVLPSANTKSVRVTLEMRAPVGDITVQAFFQYTPDGYTFGTAVPIGDVVDTAAGPVYGTDWIDISTDALTGMRFGVIAANDTTEDLNLAYVVIKIESRET